MSGIQIIYRNSDNRLFSKRLGSGTFCILLKISWKIYMEKSKVIMLTWVASIQLESVSP